MSQLKPLLSVDHLVISTLQDPRVLINDVTFEVHEGEAVGVVGESGSGKTLSALSILGLLPRGVAVTKGSIEYNGIDLANISSQEMRKIRGSEISMVYQDPMTALNPVMKIGDQLLEVIESHEKIDSSSEERVREALREVGIPDVTSNGKLSARIFGRDAPARHDRDGTYTLAQIADRGRTNHRARRHDSAADTCSGR